ncbi:LIC11966 family surface protein [Fluviicola chungangensis]|uniref:DUF3829 domain-containing protein n=1 Tax=Fluviicola chungangensis TaxID=2597671 RepID=A0A556MXX0_9FLAO|nr:hypothetical protein [Fluviicola chungangensis]TSJ44747.1 hypothetical protein FO442_09095 [Fluviicola chungangensis]
MKNRLLKITLMIAFFGTANTYAQTAVEYMNVFTAEYGKIQQDMWDYTSSVSHGKSARKVEKRRVELIQTSNAALSKAKSAKGFNGSTQFRDSVIEYFRIANLVLKEDYAKIVDMEAVSEESYDAMEAYMLARERANDKLIEASEMISREQKSFAGSNNINLITSDDPLDKKMAVAGEVYDTYNEIYLIFFKSFKQEVYLMDAIGRQDINAIEQNRNALVAAAEEGLKKLDAVKPYKNDKSMVEATRKLLNFYIEEGKNETPKMADYFMKTENFNKVKKAFDEIPEKKRTQADVDGYNKAVNEMNAGVNTFNATTQNLNKKRSALIDSWNATAEKFTDTHVPKGK